MQDKQYACLAHEQSCAGCGSVGDDLIDWNGGPQPVFMFDSFEQLNEFARTGLCHKCQVATRQ